VFWINQCFSKTTQIAVALSILFLMTTAAFAGPGDPVISSVSINVAANTLTISGVNLLGSDSAGVFSVTLGSIPLTVQSASTISITAGFPAASPASSLAAGTYPLSVRFYSIKANVNNYATFQVTVGGSGTTGSSFNSVLAIDALSCTTGAGQDAFPLSAWTTGAASSSPSSGGGQAGGKAQFSNLVVNKSFDDCSTDLFEDVMLGRHIRRAVLTQYVDGSAVLILTLTELLAVDYTLNVDDNASPKPTEVWGFTYNQIVIKNVVTGSTACFNMLTQTTC